MTDRRVNRRIRVLGLLFAVALLASLGRAAWLQTVRSDDFGKMASRQHREVITIPAGRGTIFDRTGEPLAIGEQATTVYADPALVKDKRRVALAAAKTLGLDADEVYRSISEATSRFVFVQRQADPEQAAELEKLGLPGLGFYNEEKRTYPQARVAAQVLGYAGTDNTGLDGLERALEKRLRGRPGSETVVKDPFGRAVDVVDAKPERPGKSVVLTLDHQIQGKAEQVLTQKVAQFNAAGATAIVVDLERNGAVLAMANAPTIDANRFGQTRVQVRRNRAVTDLYEPGSTFKIVTIAAALEDRVVTPKTPFYLPSTIRVADRVIHEAHWRPAVTLSVREILSQSSNVGTIKVGQRLGAGPLSAWIARFGFGVPTGVDFPGESPGIVLPLDQWSGSTIGTVPIGQGIAVTPMQMVSAYAAIGSGGVLPTPYLVDRVGGKRVRHPKGRRVVSEETADRMMAMFRDVVLEGTGTEAAIPGYTVAGKTGTAQKAENGRYVRKYVASFVGLVPAKRPRLAILVMVDEPKGSIFGGVVAAPAFRDLARFALQYLEVPPDAPETRRESSLVALGVDNRE